MKLTCLIYCIQKIINVPKIFAKKIFFIENLEFVQKMSSPVHGLKRGPQMQDLSTILCFG